MTTAVQHRRGTTAEHAAFTGLEGELTIDTTKDTAVIHDGTLAGGYPLAKENLANVNTSGLSSIDGASTASDDKFFIYDQSATSLKTITRAELNNAIEQDALANVAITGGTINGTTIGGTTAAAVSATTLTTSSTVTHNGGTANSVCFLNGSKVLTTGSALTFDGTNLGVGAGTANPLGFGKVAAVNDAGSPAFALNVNGTATADFVATTTATYLSTRTATPLLFQINGSEQMRLTSTGLGIGTSSPNYIATLYKASLPVLQLANSTSGSTASDGLLIYLNGANATISNEEAGSINFQTSGTLRATLDSSGNLGLGVTPSAWDTVKAMQLANGSIYGFSTSDVSVAANMYLSSGAFRYISTGSVATQYLQTSGQHRWLNAPSGTAGNAISFTQAMTLDASGNLGVGTTVPGSFGKLSVVGTIAPVSPDATIQGIYSAANTGEIRLGGFKSGGGTFLVFTTGADVERARIDTSGNLGLGVTPSAWTSGSKAMQFSSLGMVWQQTNGDFNLGYNTLETSANSFVYKLSSIAATRFSASDSFKWFTAPSGTAGNAISFSQAMTLTAAGDLLVGRTSSLSFATARVAIEHGQPDYTLAIANSHPTSPYSIAMRYTAGAPNNTSSAYLYADDNSGAQRFSVRSNGGIYNFQANNVNLSDRREKTNFAPAKSYLETICAIPVQTFNYIDQNMEEDPGLTLGVVAQDVQAVAPELVMESNWGTEEEPKMRLSIYQTDLQYALMKCIQEQQAIIESLKARLDAANL